MNRNQKADARDQLVRGLHYYMDKVGEKSRKPVSGLVLMHFLAGWMAGVDLEMAHYLQALGELGDVPGASGDKLVRTYDLMDSR